MRLVELGEEMGRLRRHLRQARIIWGPSSTLEELEHSTSSIEEGFSWIHEAMGGRVTANPDSGEELLAVRGSHDVASMRLLTSQEQLASRLAQSLEEKIGQLLANAVVELDYSCRLIDSDGEALRAGMASLRQELQGGLDALRLFVAELRPPTLLKDLGLGPSLVHFARQISAAGQVVIDTRHLEHFQRRLPPSMELATFRILQEALRNAGQHAHASHIELGVQEETEGVTFFVQDDGCGIPPEAPAKSQGLIYMQESARAIGATLRVFSREGIGTSVLLLLPESMGKDAA